MTISQNKGNALNLQQGILVHGCNCHGVMGGGIALHIKNKWLDVFTAYKDHQAKVGLRLGDVNFVASTSFQDTPVAKHIHAFSDQLPPGVIVANAMTQQDYGNDPNVVYVSYDAVEAAFARIALVARVAGLEVHFPLIGCGLANGKWTEVGPRIDGALREVQGQLWEL